ncbi:MAG: response regulator transcription factor [Anaerolineales bacterium]|nr:response regulator transcription factor [Anaerolineales bacterium]
MSKIMIVDDDSGATSLLEKLMKMEGHAPTAVNDSKLAVGVANIIQPDLFILDLMMPEPTGFQLCRMLRQDKKFAATPILILSALDDNDSRIVAFGAGANDYVTKPFRVDEFLQKVRDWLK